MSNHSQNEGQEQRNQEQEFYESDEVVWAKVKGYPWWPGYVRSVYQVNSDGEVQYEVHFFGDNTHSRLGQSKIRKFLFKYKEFYKSAKVNRKLKLSIQKAEQKLKENNQNVQIFDNIRNQMRGKQRGRRPACRTQSKVDSSDHHINAFDTPELSKLNNQIAGRVKTHDARIQKRVSQNQAHESQSKSPKRGSHPRIQQQSPGQDQQPLQPNSQKAQKSSRSFKIAKIRQKKKPRGRRPKIRRPSPVKDSSASSSNEQQQQKIQQQKPADNQQSQKNQENQEQQQNQQSSSSSQEDQQPLKNIRRGSFKQRGPRGRGPRGRRRGTIRKVRDSQPSSSSQPPQQQPQQQQQEQVIDVPSIQQKRSGKGRKRGRKKNVQNTAMSRQQQRSNQNQQIQQSVLQQELPQNLKLMIMERLNFCIENRQQLIQTLSKIPITIDNIKDILDLGVADIIKDGEITNEARFLLQFLKAVILYKYFPDDLKIKKKYQKIVKKKALQNRSQDRKIQDQYTLTNQDLQIRKKTIVKLQKIIRDQAQQRSRQLAQKIQTQFRKRDPTIGDQYKRFAYQILRSLKDKKLSAQEVLLKIQNEEYD